MDTVFFFKFKKQNKKGWIHNLKNGRRLILVNILHIVIVDVFAQVTRSRNKIWSNSQTMKVQTMIYYPYVHRYFIDILKISEMHKTRY